MLNKKRALLQTQEKQYLNATLTVSLLPPAINCIIFCTLPIFPKKIEFHGLTSVNTFLNCEPQIIPPKKNKAGTKYRG